MSLFYTKNKLQLIGMQLVFLVLYLSVRARRSHQQGGWAIAQSPILGTTITLKRLKQKGYESLTEIYIQLNPSLCEPPST